MDDQELQAINPREAAVDGSLTEQDLPKVDGGLQAWLVLASAFVQGALVWGKATVTATGLCTQTDFACRIRIWFRRVPGVLLTTTAIRWQRLWTCLDWHYFIGWSKPLTCNLQVAHM